MESLLLSKSQNQRFMEYLNIGNKLVSFKNKYPDFQNSCTETQYKALSKIVLKRKRTNRLVLLIPSTATSSSSVAATMHIEGERVAVTS